MVNFNDIKQQIIERFMTDVDVINKFNITAGQTFEDKFKPAGLMAKIINIVAYICFVRETALEGWREDVDATALATRYGTKEWWYAVARAWQQGSMTSVIDGKVGYEVIDESRRVVNYVAVVEDGRTIYLKVAKGEIGNLSPLTEYELSGFQSYIADVKPLGLRVVCQSYEADIMDIGLSVYYDGERVQSDLDSEVKERITTYISTIQFGGVILTSKIVDAAQGVSGVKDVVVNSIMAGSAGEDVAPVGRIYNPRAGYTNIRNWQLNYIIE